MPSGQDLAAFAQIPNELHARRAATLAGRAWTDVSVEGTAVTLISFWVKRGEVRPATIALVADALGQTGKYLVEFRDSRSPTIFEFPPSP